ncbi:MAG: zinc ribbon domain-containing protein [Syntrophobacterales bacterium]|nr:zinc ribbon domain-containing protein [Syntrophobacterales bacterium]
MPIYEYRCLSCGRKSEFITFRVSEEISPLICSHCGGTDLARLISRVRVRLSEETRLERLSDPTRWSHFDENDPRSVANFMKTLGREMGNDDMEADDIDSLVEETMEAERVEDSLSEGKTG